MAKIVLLIDEEYGYRTWKAVLDKREYDELIGKWLSMRNLSCLVPVRWVIPQAVQIEHEEVMALLDGPYRTCRLHDHDDSHLDGVPRDYVVPEDDPYGPFWINGQSYSVWGVGNDRDAFPDTLPPRE